MESVKIKSKPSNLGKPGRTDGITEFTSFPQVSNGTDDLLPWLWKPKKINLSEKYSISTSVFQWIMIQSTFLNDIKIVDSHILENNIK